MGMLFEGKWIDESKEQGGGAPLYIPQIWR